MDLECARATPKGSVGGACPERRTEKRSLKAVQDRTHRHTDVEGFNVSATRGDPLQSSV